MKTVKIDVSYSEKASRLELLIRFIWLIPTAIVVLVLAVILMIAWCLQFLHILFMGRRNKTLHDWILKYVSYRIKYESYFFSLTDERNPIIPEN